MADLLKMGELGKTKGKRQKNALFFGVYF